MRKTTCRVLRSGDMKWFLVKYKIQHDVYRTRLEMYCTLVFVSVSLMLFTPIALLRYVNIIAVAITFASFALMSAVSYFAALSSADGYCFALKQMDKASPTPDER